MGVTVKDVPAKEFIQEYAKFLKKGNKIRIPEWAAYYKTACYKDLAPYDPDWLYIRAASVAYQLYMRQKVGVNTLESTTLESKETELALSTLDSLPVNASDTAS